MKALGGAAGGKPGVDSPEAVENAGFLNRTDSSEAAAWMKAGSRDERLNRDGGGGGGAGDGRGGL